MFGICLNLSITIKEVYCDYRITQGKNNNFFLGLLVHISFEKFLLLEEEEIKAYVHTFALGGKTYLENSLLKREILDPKNNSY